MKTLLVLTFMLLGVISAMAVDSVIHAINSSHADKPSPDVEWNPCAIYCNDPEGRPWMKPWKEFLQEWRYPGPYKRT